MNDRRRIDGPAGGTTPPVYLSSVVDNSKVQRPFRSRKPNQLRKTYRNLLTVLRTGLAPSASGSAYLELEPSSSSQQSSSLIVRSPCIKLACTVHGPRPLPRSAPFSPQLILSAHVKFTPFASCQRRGYIRDATERDLSAHLESALKGVIIGDRWPKSGVDVTVTVIEAQDDCCGSFGSAVEGQWRHGAVRGWESMAVLASCITVASAALAEAGIDCVDLVTGGFSGLVVDSVIQDIDEIRPTATASTKISVVLDPCPSEHDRIVAGCVVGQLSSRDETVELWIKGDPVDDIQTLITQAISAADGSRGVLTEVMKELTDSRVSKDKHSIDSIPSNLKGKGNTNDVEMAG